MIKHDVRQPRHPISKYDNASLMYWIALYGWQFQMRVNTQTDRLEYSATKDGEQYGWYSGITDREPLEKLAVKCGIGFPPEKAVS